MSGIDVNLKSNTQLAAAQALKGESIKQFSDNLEEVQAAVKILNSAMRKAPTSLEFSVDSASHRFVVNVTNQDTGELLRSLPGDAILKFAQNLESLKGVYLMIPIRTIR